jgi:shikimate dehydrogenase
VIPLLDRLTDSATLCGAVNCIAQQEGQLIGDSTEGKGMLQAIRALVEPAGKHAVLLGAGRVARAIAIELALAGAAEITIVNRTLSKAEQLAGLLSARLQATASAVAWEGEFVVPGETDLLIHATSVATEDPDRRLPLCLDTLRSDAVVADVTLNPPETPLLGEAAGRGCSAVDGLEMFIQHSLIDLKTWTGMETDRTVMREAVEEFLLL